MNNLHTEKKGPNELKRSLAAQARLPACGQQVLQPNVLNTPLAPILGAASPPLLPNAAHLLPRAPGAAAKPLGTLKPRSAPVSMETPAMLLPPLERCGGTTWGGWGGVGGPRASGGSAAAFAVCCRCRTRCP